MLHVFCFIFSSLLLHAAVMDPVYDEFEGLDLVSALLKDGKLTTAEEELKKVSHPSERFFTLYGEWALQGKKYDQARSWFSKLHEGSDRHFGLARAFGGLSKWQECQDHFMVVPKSTLNEPDILLKALCEQKANSPDRALETLEDGQRLKGFAIFRALIDLHLELGLQKTALDKILNRNPELSSSESSQVAELFLNRGHLRETLLILEAAQLRDPDNLDLNLSLAKTYYQRHNLQATADFFARAARQNSDYAYHASEIYRQIGQTETARYFALFVPDSTERTRARFARYVDRDQFPLVAATHSSLNRGPAKIDEDMRYALAYSLARVGDYPLSLKYLNQVTSPAHAEKAARLRGEVLKQKNILSTN